MSEKNILIILKQHINILICRQLSKAQRVLPEKLKYYQLLGFQNSRLVVSLDTTEIENNIFAGIVSE
jgi:hypothetical protein